MSAAAYDDALRTLYALSSRGVELGLGRLESVLEARDNPHRKLRFVHVAGTNGKGSVSALVERMLRAAGYRTGLYTSPHLHRFGERIRVDGRPIADRDVVRRVRALSAAGAFETLTFFEAATLMAFEHFVDAGCDVVVLEVGLGGRLDATNVARAEVSVVTNIGLDHAAYLGTTHAAVAGEKVAIVKPGGTLVHTVDVPEARAVVEAHAAKQGARAIDVHRDVRVVERGGRASFTLGQVRVDDVPHALAGAHQRTNLALAVTTALVLRERGLDVDDDAIRAGARLVRWPARLELLPRHEGRARVLVDGAHNPEGCAALAAHLDTLPRHKRVLLFGAMIDKDLPAMLGTLRPRFDDAVFVAPELARAARPEALAALVDGRSAESVEAGLRLGKQLAGPRGLVVAAGSLFVVAAVRASELGLRVDPPIAM